MQTMSAQPHPIDVYTRNDWAQCRAADDQELVQRCIGPDTLVPTALLRAIGEWRGFASFDAHIERLRADPEAAARLRHQFEECVRRGLLVSNADILGALAANDSATAPAARISTFAVMTRDRPALLRRALESYIKSTVDFGHRLAFRVMDDSSQPAAIDENSHTVATLRHRYGVSIEHITPADIAAFEQELVRRSGAAPDVIHFALYGAYGANRNRLSLRTVGERFICADDDTLCDFFSTQTNTGWALESSADREAWFFPERAAVFAAVKPVAVDLVTSYEAVLGAAPFNILAGMDAADLHSRTLMSTSLRRLLAPSARVFYCMPGIAGDCAQSNSSALMIAGTSRAQVFKDEQAYRLALSTREVVRQVTRPLLTTSPACMAYCLGIDNAVLTPPFFTRNRNSDGVYGMTLSMLYANAAHVEFPFSVKHDPDGTRTYNSTDAVQTCYAISTADIVMSAIRNVSAFSMSTGPSRRLTSIGTDLHEMTSGSLFAFEQAVRSAINRSLGQRAEQLSQLLQEFHGEPEYWAKDLRRGIEGVRQRILDSSPIVPADRVANGDALEVCQGLQRDVQLFGRVMVEWETLRHAAAEISERK
jgi:hypothetical protein